MPRSFALALAKLAEAGHVARIDGRCVMRGPQAVRKRALPLGSPHDSVDVIGTGIILDQAGKEIPVVGIVDAKRLGIPPVEVSLLNFLDVRQVGAKHVLKPADDFHAALLRRGEHFGQDIQVAVIGCARVLDDRVLVVLGMRRGEVAAVKIEIVFLLPMIGQRLARNLPSRNTATIGEYRKKQRIHAGAFLKHIENFLGAFIHKRNCSDLDADHFGGEPAAVCPKVGNARAAPAPAAIFMNSRRFTSEFQHGLLLLFLVAADIYFSRFDSWRTVKIQFPRQRSGSWRRQQMRENLIADENRSWTGSTNRGSEKEE